MAAEAAKAGQERLAGKGGQGRALAATEWGGQRYGGGRSRDEVWPQSMDVGATISEGPLPQGQSRRRESLGTSGLGCGTRRLVR